MEKKKMQKKAISGNPPAIEFKISSPIWMGITHEICKELGKLNEKRTACGMVIKRDVTVGNHEMKVPRVTFEIILEGTDVAEGNLMDIFYRKGELDNDGIEK